MNEPKIAGKRPFVSELEPRTYSWCRCGRSDAQPYCDGSHEGTGLTPLDFTITEKKRYALCVCKRTLNQPFCDGAHKALKDD
jgi:CDGSH-type Zn-finger protein